MNPNAPNNDSVRKPRIFVSHSTIDKVYCDKIVRHLKETGCITFYSWHDCKNDYRDEIDTGVEDCDVFFLVASRSAFLSEEVKKELIAADEAKIEIVYYKLDNTPHTRKGFKTILSGKQYIQASKNDLHLSTIDSFVSDALKRQSAKYLESWKEKLWSFQVDNQGRQRKLTNDDKLQLAKEAGELGITINIEEEIALKPNIRDFYQTLRSMVAKNLIDDHMLEDLEEKRVRYRIHKGLAVLKLRAQLKQKEKRAIHQVTPHPDGIADWFVKCIEEFLSDFGISMLNYPETSQASQAKPLTSDKIIFEVDAKISVNDGQPARAKARGLAKRRVNLPSQTENSKAVDSKSSENLNLPIAVKHFENTQKKLVVSPLDNKPQNQLKNYQFTGGSLIYTTAYNPESIYVKLLEIRQERSGFIFIGKRGSRQSAFQENFENGFTRAIRWDRFFKLYPTGHRTGIQITYISGSKDCQVFEEFLSELGIPVMDAPSTIDKTSQASQEGPLSRDQQIIEVNVRNPVNQSQTSEAKALSTPNKQRSIIKPAIAESKEPKAVFEFSEKSTVLFQISKGQKTIVITLQKAKKTQSTFVFSGHCTIRGSQKVLEIESFKEIIMGNNSAKLVQDEQNFLVIGFDRFACDNSKVKSFCESVRAPILEDNEAKLPSNLVEMFGNQANLTRDYAAENTFQSTNEGKPRHSFLASKDASLHSSITSPWIHPSRPEDKSLCDTLLKHQQFQQRLITKILSFDAASRLDQLFRDLKQPLNLFYGLDLYSDSRMRKVLKKHGQLQNQGYKPLVCFKNNGWITSRSLIVFDRGVSFQAGNNSQHLFKFGIPGQRITGRINFQVNNNNLKIKALSPTLLFPKTFEVAYDFRPVRSHCEAFSDSLSKILADLDDHQINYARLRESLVNELWEGLSSQNFVAPVSFHLYGNSVITPLSKSSLDPILTTLFNGAKTMIPYEQDYLFSLSVSYSAPLNNYRSAFLVTLHGIAYASVTTLEINGQFINWSELSEFIFTPSGRSFFEIKRRHLKSHLPWPTLPGKEQAFSEIAAFVMSLKERLSTLPAR